jgi:hypothetical protein
MQTWVCKDCSCSFNSYNAYWKHINRSKIAIEAGKPSCVQKIESKRRKREVDRMCRSEIVEIVKQVEESDFDKSVLLEKESKISELENLNNQLQSKYTALLDLVRECYKKGKTIVKPQLTNVHRNKIARLQYFKCACCTEMLDAVFHIDHKNRWIDTFDNSDDNLQALCITCHGMKTAQENST